MRSFARHEMSTIARPRRWQLAADALRAVEQLRKPLISKTGDN